MSIIKSKFILIPTVLLIISLLVYLLYLQTKVIENEYYRLSKETLVFEGGANRWIGKIDFNNDGNEDLILGGEEFNKKSKVRILINIGEGLLEEQTDTYVTNNIPDMFVPFGEVADYNNDGTDDIFIVDGGGGTDEYNENNSGGFLGGEPSLLISDGNGKWLHSEIITDEIWRVKNDPNIDANENTGRTLHAKALAAGDIDADGDIDIAVESGGGADVLDPFFLINTLSETGELGFKHRGHLLNPELVDHEAVWGFPRETSTWRYGAHELFDFNNDGYDDWLRAQLRATPPSQQSSGYHRIIYNTGEGNFEGIVGNQKLSWPDWEEGYSYSRAIVIGDLNNDKLPDIVISQDRNNKNEYCCTGRYIQTLINNGLDEDGRPVFTDKTKELLGDQSKTIPYLIDGIDNANNAQGLEIVDFNNDGLNDILMGKTLGHATDEVAPLVYMNNGKDFSVVPPEIFTFGKDDWGWNPYFLDLNGDNLTDFVFAQPINGGEKYEIFSVVSKSAY